MANIGYGAALDAYLQPVLHSMVSSQRIQQAHAHLIANNRAAWEAAFVAEVSRYGELGEAQFNQALSQFLITWLNMVIQQQGGGSVMQPAAVYGAPMAGMNPGYNAGYGTLPLPSVPQPVQFGTLGVTGAAPVVQPVMMQPVQVVPQAQPLSEIRGMPEGYEPPWVTNMDSIITNADAFGEFDVSTFMYPNNEFSKGMLLIDVISKTKHIGKPSDAAGLLYALSGGYAPTMMRVTHRGVMVVPASRKEELDKALADIAKIAVKNSTTVEKLREVLAMLPNYSHGVYSTLSNYILQMFNTALDGRILQSETTHKLIIVMDHVDTILDFIPSSNCEALRSFTNDPRYLRIFEQLVEEMFNSLCQFKLATDADTVLAGAGSLSGNEGAGWKFRIHTAISDNNIEDLVKEFSVKNAVYSFPQTYVLTNESVERIPAMARALADTKNKCAIIRKKTGDFDNVICRACTALMPVKIFEIGNGNVATAMLSTTTDGLRLYVKSN